MVQPGAIDELLTVTEPETGATPKIAKRSFKKDGDLHQIGHTQ